MNVVQPLKRRKTSINEPGEHNKALVDMKVNKLTSVWALAFSVSLLGASIEYRAAWANYVGSGVVHEGHMGILSGLTKATEHPCIWMIFTHFNS